jgi:hypothetical protein
LYFLLKSSSLVILLSNNSSHISHSKSVLEGTHQHPDDDHVEFSKDVTADVSISHGSNCLASPINRHNILLHRCHVQHSILKHPGTCVIGISLGSVEPDTGEDVNEEDHEGDQFGHSNEPCVDLEGLNVSSNTSVHLKDLKHPHYPDKPV